MTARGGSMDHDRRKPECIVYAEWALWAWTVWACLYGIYSTWRGMPEIQQQLDQLQGLITIDPHSLMPMAIAGYVALAVFSAWFIVKIGQGKNWARSSFLWGFVCEVIAVFIPPYHAPLEYIASIPDFGLQIYALYYLYTAPNSAWFHPPARRA